MVRKLDKTCLFCKKPRSKLDGHHWIYGKNEVEVSGYCYNPCHKIANGLQKGLYVEIETLSNIIDSMPDNLFVKWYNAFIQSHKKIISLYNSKKGD